jgi:hypothetical protein
MESTTVNTSLVKVRTGDGADFSVPFNVLTVSGYFRDFLEGRESVEEVLEIGEFGFVSKEMFEAVIEFSTLVANSRIPKINKPIQHQSIYEVVSPNFAAFADKFKDDKLAQLILVANTLNNESLLEVLSAKLAIDLSKFKEEDFRKYFSIATPFDNDAEIERVK